jgi:hypothetical protein
VGVGINGGGYGTREREREKEYNNVYIKYELRENYSKPILVCTGRDDAWLGLD